MSYRTFFIGDVHGCYDELIALLTKIGLKEEDHLYFVGDLINKGPKSREVLEYVKDRPNTWSVIGNHELFYLIRKGEYSDTPSQDQISESDEIDRNIPSQYRSVYDEVGLDIIDWVKTLPLFIERDNFIVIHGGVHPDHGLDTPPEIATLIRTVHGRPWYEYYEGDKPIIYGHWAADGLRVRRNTIGLDTGCCFGGHLTAYCLETGEYSQVRAEKVYEIPKHWETTSFDSAHKSA